MLIKSRFIALLISVITLSAQGVCAQDRIITRDQLQQYYDGYAKVLLKDDGIERYLDKYIADSYQLVSKDLVKIPGQPDSVEVNRAGKAGLISSTLEAQQSMSWKSLKPHMQNVVIGQTGQNARVVNMMTGTANMPVVHPETRQPTRLVIVIKSICSDEFVLNDSGMQVTSSDCQTEAIFRF